MATTKRASRKSSGRKYSKGASKKVARAVRKQKHGTLRSGKSGHGGKVKSRKQAIAIGLSEAREAGEKVPSKKKSSSRKKSSTRKRSSSSRKKSSSRK
jgi:hypothetical protein